MPVSKVEAAVGVSHSRGSRRGVVLAEVEQRGGGRARADGIVFIKVDPHFEWDGKRTKCTM